MGNVKVSLACAWPCKFRAAKGPVSGFLLRNLV